MSLYYAMRPPELLSKKEMDSLVEDVARLSKLLTRERDVLPEDYLKEPGLRRAYLQYFLPSNIFKMHLPLKELALHPRQLLSGKKLKILDIGSGPGTAVLGALGFFSQRTARPVLEFTAVDRVAANLEHAEAMFRAQSRRYGGETSLQTVRCGADELEGRVSKARFDLITLSNVLNELFRNDAGRLEKRAAFLKSVMDGHLAPAGSCIIIEPALRETSREMHSVRDRLISEGINVFSPCLTGNACPALQNPKDWCHEDVPWDPPALVKEINAKTGLRKDSLKFSYLVLRRDGLSIADIYGKDGFRVVSEPLISKGKMEFYACGAAGRRLIVRLDRDRDAVNEAFASLTRGAVAFFENLTDEGKRLRVTKETYVAVRKVF